MFNARLSGMTDYPFTRLAGLLKDVPTPAGRPVLNLAVGEPQGAPPAMVADILASRAADWGKYPPIAGTPEFRAAAAGWLARRYRLPAGALDPDRAILPVQGTREALFQIATVASADRPGRDIVLAPNPSYATYAAAGRLAGAEVVPMSCLRENGFLPAVDRLSPDLLARTSLLYLCSPSNPEGAVADPSYLKLAVTLARTHGFMLAVDECYAEIWDRAPPPGTLEAAAVLGPGANGDPFANVVVFHSLSKRSSAAGLRSGFVAGDRAAIALMQRLRTYASSAPPLPILAASTALWSDEAHVEAGRAAYRRKLDLAEAALKGRAGFYRPAGGFFLWLEVGDGPAVAQRLWREAGIRVLPGAYMGREDETGRNAGQAFVRLALVHDDSILEPALRRMAELV